MTVAANVPKNLYTASGSNPIFPYTFKIFAASELAVLFNGAPLGVGFSIDGVGSATGGNVTFAINPPAGSLIVLYRVTPLSQATDWIANDGDPAEAKENAFDKAVNIDQELDERLDRTPSYKRDNIFVTDPPTIDAPVSGQFLQFKDALGNIGAAVPALGTALSNPVALGQGGTGINAASLAALMKTFGVRLNAGPAGNTSLSPSAGAVVVPNPLTTGIWSVQGGNFSSLSASPGALDVGSEFVFYYAAGGNVITPSGTLFPLGGVAWTTSAGDMSLFRYVGGAQFVEVARIYAGQYNGTLAASQSPLFLRADGAFVQAAVVYMNGIIGLTLANNAGDAVNDIDIAVGSVLSDAANPALKEPMYLASGLTKQLDAAWVVGTNQGMRCTGVALADGTYHIFLAKRMDTGVVDVFADSSATGANVVATNANYTKKQRIGSILRVAGTILAFVQDGDKFLIKASVLVEQTNPGTAAVTRAVTAPVGIKTDALVAPAVLGGTTNNVQHYLSSFDQNDETPNAAAGGALTGPSSATGNASATWTFNAITEIRTNTSAQIRSRMSASGVADRAGFVSHGWVDYSRGRN